MNPLKQLNLKQWAGVGSLGPKKFQAFYMYMCIIVYIKIGNYT